MPVIYPDAAPRTLNTKLGTRVDFYNDFGCACDGVTDDTTAAQNALDSIAGLSKYIYIPHGRNLAVNHLSIPSGVVIAGDGPQSLMSFIGSPSSGIGRIDVPAGTTDWGLENFSIDGGVTAPVGIDYASISSPLQASLSDGSSIWIHGGSGAARGLIERLRIKHTGGYSILFDALAGNMSGYKVRRCEFADNRPHTFGVSGSFIYGGWTSGIHYESDGALYIIEDLLVEGNHFYRMSGHCFWGHALASLALCNRNIRFDKNFVQDGALDACEMGVVDGFSVQDNYIDGTGYLSLTDGTPGAPMYGTVSPVAIDNTGKCINGKISGNVIVRCNGTAIDGDGLGKTTISYNDCSSAWVSDDPNADVPNCGSLGTGVNTASGFNLGNTYSDPSAGSDVSLIGNKFRGFATGSGRFFTGRNCKAHGNTVHAPCNATVSPFVMGPLGSSPYLRNHGVDVSGNTIYWNPGTLTASGFASVTNGSTSVTFVSGVNFPAYASGNSLVLNGVEYTIGLNFSTTAGLTTPYRGPSGTVAFGYYTSVGGAAVTEDASIASFDPTDVNIVRDNVCIGNFVEFFKNADSSSTTGPVTLHSVTPQATTLLTSGQTVGTIQQTEGDSLATHVHKEYRSDGALLRSSTATTTDIPSLSIGGSGVVDNARNIYGNSVTVLPGEWVAGHNYSTGDLAFDGTNIQQASSTHTSQSPSAPTWNATVGGTTTETTGLTWVNRGLPVAIAYDKSAYLAQVYIDAAAGPVLAIDNTGAYVGPLNPSTLAMGTLSLSVTTPIESHRLVVQSNGALNNADNRSPATFLLGSAATSMRVVEDYVYPYPTSPVQSREAALMCGTIVDASTTNWETNGIISTIVNKSPSKAAVAGSFFGVSAATGSVTWAQNWLVIDYINFNKASCFASTLIGVEIDMHAAHTGSNATSISTGIELPGDRRFYGANSFNCFVINTEGGYPGATSGFLSYNYFDNGLLLTDGACDVGLWVGRAPITKGVNSQFINFASGSGGTLFAPPHLAKIYAASDGTMIIFPNTESGGAIPLAIFGSGKTNHNIFSATSSFQIEIPAWIGGFHFYSLNQEYLDSNGNIQRVIVAGTGSNTHPVWNVTVGGNTTDNGVTWKNLGVPALVNVARDAYFDSLTIVSPFVTNARYLVIDNTGTADFAQVKIGGTVVIDASRNITCNTLTASGLSFSSIFVGNTGYLGGSTPSGNGYVNGFNTQVVSGAYVTLGTPGIGNRAGYLEFTNLGANFVVTSNVAGSSPNPYPLSSMTPVVALSISTTGGVTLANALTFSTGSCALLTASTALQIGGFNVFDSARNCYANSVSIGLYGSSTIVINSSQQATFSALTVGVGGATFNGAATFVGAGFSVNASNINGGAYYCNSTQVMDSFRNLTNIANLGVGTITCTNNISAGTSGSGRFVCNSQPGITGTRTSISSVTITGGIITAWT